MRLNADLLGAAVPGEGGRGPGESGILDAQAVLGLRLLQAGAQRRSGHRRVQRRPVRAQRGRGRVHRDRATVGAAHVRSSARIRHVNAGTLFKTRKKN